MLGSSAIPYLQEVIHENTASSFTDIDDHRLLAKAAAYVIDPTLYDTVFPSPDGKYAVRSLISTVNEAAGIPNDRIFHLIVQETGDILAVSTICCDDFSVSWSPDNRYAEITGQQHRYASIVTVFDIPGQRVVPMPDLEILETIEDAFGHPFDLYSLHITFNEWGIHDEITCSVKIMTGAASNARWIDGSYIYDLSQNKIVDLQYEGDAYYSISKRQKEK